MPLRKNIILGKIKFFLFFFNIMFLQSVTSFSEELSKSEKYAELNILDKLNYKLG